MATDQPYADLVELDEAELATIIDAYKTRWTQTDELLALNAQVTYELVRMWAKRDPGPLKIKRPNEQPKTVSPGQFARQLLGR